MNAPTTRDPLVVNTQDGCCWTRRAVNRVGRGLYALADVKGPVPELVLASLAELAEHGLASMTNCLPVPAGVPHPPSELDRLRQRLVEVDRAYEVDTAALQRRIDGLEAERHSTNELLSKADVQRQADRDRIAELEALTPAAIQTCRVCDAGYTYGGPCETCVFRARMAAETDGITQRIAPTQALQLGPLAEWVAETFSPKPAAEGEFHAYLHRAFTTPHDLPETGGAL